MHVPDLSTDRYFGEPQDQCSEATVCCVVYSYFPATSRTVPQRRVRLPRSFVNIGTATDQARDDRVRGRHVIAYLLIAIDKPSYHAETTQLVGGEVTP